MRHVQAARHPGRTVRAIATLSQLAFQCVLPPACGLICSRRTLAHCIRDRRKNRARADGRLRERAKAPCKRLLRATVQLFAEQGHAATTVNEIGARSGRSSGTVYFHRRRQGGHRRRRRPRPGSPPAHPRRTPRRRSGSHSRAAHHPQPRHRPCIRTDDHRTVTRGTAVCPGPLAHPCGDRRARPGWPAAPAPDTMAAPALAGATIVCRGRCRCGGGASSGLIPPWSGVPAAGAGAASRWPLEGVETFREPRFRGITRLGASTAGNSSAWACRAWLPAVTASWTAVFGCAARTFMRGRVRSLPVRRAHRVASQTSGARPV
ncbi:helix-turn-helix domain-containing protein [Streptomyces glaucescens]|uniref:helix-turn-helix domain-containing protein n=1 Tax=Streptomyces glaucescens TaxID=1907 RepID=UPI001FE89DC6|nr:helix-turn-helix domain-containing protein [Streptomyces glaucescens]